MLLDRIAEYFLRISQIAVLGRPANCTGAMRKVRQICQEPTMVIVFDKRIITGHQYDGGVNRS